MGNDNMKNAAVCICCVSDFNNDINAKMFISYLLLNLAVA